MYFFKNATVGWICLFSLLLNLNQPSRLLAADSVRIEAPILACNSDTNLTWDFDLLSKDDQLRFLADALVIASRGSLAKTSHDTFLSEPLEKLLLRYDSFEEASRIGKSVLNRPEVPNCGLSGLEVYSLKFYSLNGFFALNTYLRTPLNARDPNSFWLSLVSRYLTSALEKFKPYLGKVKRGTSMPLEKLKLHKTGSVVQYDAFTSTSITKPYPGQQLEITSLTGRYIDPFSFYGGGMDSGENEVLIPAGAYFRVVQGYDENTRQTIILEEVTPQEAKLLSAGPK